jgi:predicted Ser/Thr protein kinase
VLLCQSLTGEPFLNYLFSPTCKANVPPMARALLESCLGENAAGPLVDCDGLVEALDDLIRQLPGKQATSETPPLGSAVISPANTPPQGKAVPLPAKTPVDEKLPFQQLGHFQIVEQIGSGGMGDVYKGYDASLDRYVAIKVLAAPLARDEHFVLRFNAEATAAAKLSHPNVVPIYFIGQDAGHHFFAMQFIEGQSLAQRLSREKRLPVDEAVTTIEQCLAGLDAAHAHGLIHRDIKPGNILLERTGGRAVLVDFGLVRHLNADARMTATGVVMGTVDYIAPEQARGRAIDGRTDVYSLGVMFYELLAGRLPFISDSPTAMVFQHAYEEPFPLKQAAPDAPQPLVAVIAHMMEKEPDERYASCAAVLADLRAFREGRPVSVAVKPSRQQAAASIPPDYLAADLKTGHFVLPPDNAWQRARDWVATMFRRHAPQYFQEMQNTTLQMDAAVAHYQRRCNRLASLLQEARGIETELAQQIEVQLAGAAAAAVGAEASVTEHDRQAAQAKQSEYENNVASLRSQHDLQRQQVEELERQRNKADATLARLQSQQNILKARLKAAEDRRQLQGGPPRPKRRRQRVALSAATGVIALVSSLWILQKALGPAEPPVSPNLLVNGDFEDPPLAPDGFYATLPGGAVFSGWTVGGDSIDLINTRYSNAHSGNQSLDLSGNAAGSIAQSVATTPGKTYLLTFWYCGPFFHPYGGDAYAEVLWDGVVVDKIHRPASLSVHNMPWTFASYKVTANTPSSLLKFNSLSPNSGIILDQVSLVAVPEEGEPITEIHENAPANLIVNGGFEEPKAPLDAWATVPGGQSFSGWMVEGHSVDVMNTRHAAAHSGDQALDLTGMAPGSIVQNVATTPGKIYLLTFWYCGHWFHPYAGEANAEVFWDGVLVDTIHRPGSSSAKDMNWTLAGYKLRAITTSTPLKFRSLSPNGGIMLDDVSLVAVPEDAGAKEGIYENIPGNLIVNGGFEGPPLAPAGDTTEILGGRSFQGWIVGGQGIDLHNTYHTAAHSGNQSLDLSGKSPGSIAQSVPTTPGTTYLLRFWYCGSPCHPYSGDAFAEVFWDGDLIDKIHLPASPSTIKMNWTYAGYTLTAKTTSTLLKFNSLSPNGGIILDDVSLVAIPKAGPPVLLAYYPFEDDRERTTADVSGGPRAKFTGKAHLVAAGKYGSAAEFRNAGDWIDTGRSVLDTTKTWSVAAWVWFFDGFADDFRTAISQDGDRHSAFYLQYCLPSGGTAPDSLCLAKWKTARGEASLGAYRRGQPEANRWIHLAAVHDVERKKLQLYIDGELAHEQSYDAAGGAYEWPAKGNTVIGRGLCDGRHVNQFFGRIDEVYLFQGALSAKDVRAIRDNKFFPQRPRS